MQTPTPDAAGQPALPRCLTHSVLCHQSGARLDVELLEHCVVGRLITTREKDSVSLLCSSEGLAQALADAIKTLDLDNAQSAFWVVELAVSGQPINALGAARGEQGLTGPDLTPAQADKQGPSIHQGVEDHEDPAVQRRQKAAADLHRFTPILFSEGQALHGLGHEIVVQEGPRSPAMHLSRSAPLCKDCKHSAGEADARTLQCAHPAQPVNPVDGTPILSALGARTGNSRVVGFDFLRQDRDTAWQLCGPKAALFQPRLELANGRVE